MTEYEKQLLDLYCGGEIALEKFQLVFPIELETSSENLFEAVKLISATKDAGRVDRLITLIFTFDDLDIHVEALNNLLVTPHHFFHQAIAKSLQNIASPTTVPFVKQVLEMGFDFLEYTCSESETIGKWLSWVLYRIGTPEAIAVIKEYTESEDEGLAEAMQYRLAKVEASN